MATCADGKESVPVVLRVKRKRTDDPADALVVSKIRKLDPSLEEKDTSVFEFVGTVTDDSISEKTVLEHIDKHKLVEHKSLAKYNPLARLTLSDKQELVREQKKASSNTQRFKLVSKLRSLNDSEVENEPDDDLEPLRSEMVHLYDVVQELQDHKFSTELSGSTDTELKETLSGKDNTITCNSAVMAREKTSSKQLDSTDSYVYDLYYTKDCNRHDFSIFDWSSLSAYQPELVHDILDPDEDRPYSDEDDSNDENNWRNDYPDEDEMYGGGGGRSQDSSGEEGGHSNAHYRHREVDYDEYGFYNEEEVHYQDGSYWYRTDHLIDRDNEGCSD